MEIGPAVRSLIDSAAIVAMARDPLEATLLLKRLASGLSLVEITPPAGREELELLIVAMRRRTLAEFRIWAGRRSLPEVEIRAGIETYERCAAKEMAGVLLELVPAATARETLEQAVRLAAERYGVLDEDLVARDIGWGLVKCALAAAEDYAQPLRRLAPPPVR